MATKFKTFTDDEIRRKNEFCNVPVLTEGGECFIVKAVHMYLDEEHAEVDSVTDTLPCSQLRAKRPISQRS